MKYWSIKWKPKDTMKNKFIQVAATNKQEAKKKLMKKLSYINSRYIDVYQMEKRK
jgi:hypothetical protein